MELMQAMLVAASPSAEVSDELGLLAGKAVLLVMPFVLAYVFWALTYRRYRNQDARFHFEQTSSQASEVRGTDQRVGHRKGLSSAHLEGHNEDDAAAPIPVAKLWDDPPVTR